MDVVLNAAPAGWALTNHFGADESLSLFRNLLAQARRKVDKRLPSN